MIVVLLDYYNRGNRIAKFVYKIAVKLKAWKLLGLIC